MDFSGHDFLGDVDCLYLGGVGWTLIIILAGIERIPTTLYEVARLDGASAVRQFRHITLPLLRDVLRVTFVFWSIGIINLFTFPKLWTPVTPVEGTYTPAIYLYQISFGARQETSGVNTLDIGKGAAIAVMLLIAVMVFSFAINKVFRQDELNIKGLARTNFRIFFGPHWTNLRTRNSACCKITFSRK